MCMSNVCMSHSCQKVDFKTTTIITMIIIIMIVTVVTATATATATTKTTMTIVITIISVYKLGDVGISTNLIGSLSLTMSSS